MTRTEALPRDVRLWLPHGDSPGSIPRLVWLHLIFTGLLCSGLTTSPGQAQRGVAAVEFGPPTSYPCPSAIAITAADFKGDGQVDLVVLPHWGERFLVLRGNGDGSFRPEDGAVPRKPWASAYQLLAGDMNGDGKTDLATAVDSTERIYIYLGRGDGTFEPAKTNSLAGSVIDLAQADLNGDGRSDLVMRGGWGKPQLRSFLSRGDGSPHLVWSCDLPEFARGVALGDFNGDTKIDAVAPLSTSDRVHIFAGRGDGTFGPAEPLSVGAWPVWAEAGDFNEDGKLDLVTANFDADSASVLLGAGDGTFGPATEFEAGNLPVFVTAGDLNGDQHLDLVLARDQGDLLDVLLGNGDGRFRPPVAFKAGHGTRSVAIADFNGDGLVDLASANFFDATVTVLLNQSAYRDPVCSWRLARRGRHKQRDSVQTETVAAAVAEPRRSGGHYAVDRWTIDQGLPQNRVNCLLQTGDGSLWVGTQGGLARFDSLRFTTFDRNNTPAMKSDDIHSLAEGPDGTLWIGTTDGLLSLRDHRFTYFQPPRESGYVESIFPTRRSSVYVGLASGVGVVQDGAIKLRDLPIVEVGSVFEDPQGKLWIGAEFGLFRHDPESGELTTLYQTTVRGYGANRIYQDRQGSVWFGNANGLFRWRDGRIKVYRTRHGLSPGTPCSFAEDAVGALWLAVGRHVNRLQGGDFTRFDQESGLPADTVHCVCLDREGNLWGGTSVSGLFRLRARPLTTYTSRDGLVNEDVWSICEGRGGVMWIGTSKGVSRFDGKQFNRYSPCKAPVFEDSSGTVWLGEHLAVLRDGKPEAFAPGEQPLFEDVKSIYQDRAGVVWAAASRGLWRIDQDGRHCELYALARVANRPVRWFDKALGRQFILHTNALPGKHFLVGILEDYAGDLWVGSADGGLHRFRDGRFATLTTRDGLSSDYAGPLLAEPDGTLWIGSNKGLNRLKDGQITRYTTAEGLAEDNVGNLLEDDDGWFWTIGHRGIHRMRKQDLNDLAEGKRRHFLSITYDTRDGMLTSEGNLGLFPNACRASDGLLWFPTTRGVVVIDPNRMMTPEQRPPVVLEQVFADGELVFGDYFDFGAKAPHGRHCESAVGAHDVRVPCKFRPGHGRLLKFRYTANDFTAPDKLRFKYQLEGRDTAWHDGGTERFALYTDLKPGRYRFRVTAVSRDGIGSMHPAEFAFSILPCFYQTTWFRAGAGLAILLAGLGMHRLRVRVLARHQSLKQQLALALQRERIAKDMHDDLGASLTQIGLLTEHARRAPANSPAVATDMEKIAAVARQTAQAAEEIVWTVNPRHDSLESLATYLSQLARELLENTEIRLRLDMPEALPALPVPSDVRHNMVLFVKEAINNALKHAGASQITVSLQCFAQDLVLRVADDGRGVAASPHDGQPARCTSGNGLRNMRQRVESVGGQFEMSGGASGGTLLQATVKLRKGEGQEARADGAWPSFLI